MVLEQESISVDGEMSSKVLLYVRHSIASSPGPIPSFSLLHAEKWEGLGGEITQALLHNPFIQRGIELYKTILEDALQPVFACQTKYIS